MSRYYVFDAARPNGRKVKLWVDGGFESLRVVDDASFRRLQAIWKSRAALLMVVMLPAAVLAGMLYLTGRASAEVLLYILFAAALADLIARAVLRWHERRAIGALPPRPLPESAAAEMRAAVGTGDRAALRSAAERCLAGLEAANS